MLIEFSVENFASFNKNSALTMISTSKRELETHTVALGKSKKSKITLNRLAAFFGANASGKSNFFYAILLMRSIVTQAGLRLHQDKGGRKRREMPPFKPFAFTGEKPKRPTTFEVIFSIDEAIYRYGFSYNDECFSKEWLYANSGLKQDEKELFTREETSLTSGGKQPDLEAHLKYITRERLFFTVLAELKIEPYAQAIKFFQNIEEIQPLDAATIKELLASLRNYDQRLLSYLLNFADTGLQNISAIEVSEEVSEAERNEAMQQAPEEVQALFKAFSEFLSKQGDSLDSSAYRCQFQHGVYDSPREYSLSMEDESEGTLRYINLISYFLDALRNDKLLLIDEMDRSLHPLLVEGLLRLFIGVKSRAQLIFSSHCDFIFDQKKTRRDELWLVNKNNQGESHITGVSEFQARGDGNLTKRYLEGRFSGIPYVQYHLLNECVRMISAPIVDNQKEA